MKTYILAASPAYVQQQVEGFSQQIAQLKSQRDQLVNQLNAMQAAPSDPNLAFKKEQMQGQIDQMNNQIKFLEQQKTNLQKTYGG